MRPTDGSVYSRDPVLKVKVTACNGSPLGATNAAGFDSGLLTP